jgi:hypothetical protein
MQSTQRWKVRHNSVNERQNEFGMRSTKAESAAIIRSPVRH